jgi:hypothetical protein
VIATETPIAPRSRALDALDVLASEFGLPGQRAAAERAGDDWRDEVLAAVAEGLAALLIEIRPRTATAMRGGSNR